MISYFALETLGNKVSCSKIISPYFTLVHQWKPRFIARDRLHMRYTGEENKKTKISELGKYFYIVRVTCDYYFIISTKNIL